MPTYDYCCEKCNITTEIVHSIKDNSDQLCTKCNSVMIRQIGLGTYIVTGGITKSRSEQKEEDHSKKVKDFDRALKSRKKAFGSDSVGNPSDKPDPMHIVKRGRTIGGQQKEVDKKEFIKAAAKDNFMVAKAQEALNKKK